MIRRFLVFFALVTVQAWAQYPQWVNYTSAERSYSLLNDGDTLWICNLSGGLIRLQKSTGALTRYTHANARIPVNQITHAVKDAHGALWLASQRNGIGKFRGDTCQVFTSADSPLPSDHVNNAMAADSDGTLWIGSLRYIVKITDADDPAGWTIFPTGSILDAYTSINAFKRDRNGTMWIGASWGLGSIIHDTLTQRVGGFTKDISAIEIHDGTTLWIGTSSNGLFKYDQKNWTQFSTANSAIPSDIVYDLKFDHEGMLWLATSKGLAKFDGTAWTVFNTETSNLHTDAVLSLAPDNDGTLWLGFFDDCLARFDKASGRVMHRYALASTGISNNLVYYIAQDSHSNMWISTTASVTRFDGTGWTTFDAGTSAQMDASFRRVYQDSSLILWRGSGLILLLRSSGDWIVADTASSHLGGPLKEDGSGDIWYASETGLLKFHDGVRTVFNTIVPPGHVCAEIAFDMHHNMLVSDLPTMNDTGGVYKYNGSMWERLFFCDNPNDWVPGIAIDRTGTTWIGTANRSTVGMEFGGGLLKYDGTQWVRFTLKNSRLPSNSVMQLCFDRTGTLWIGTYGGGAARFDGNDGWNVFTHRNSGLPWNGVDVVYCDVKNTMWFGVHMSGLASYDNKGLVSTRASEHTSGNRPQGFMLHPNYPNPFNPSTTISFDVPHACFVSITLYTILGEAVGTIFSSVASAGTHQIVYDANGLSGGVYFYRMDAGGYSLTQKFLLLK